MASGFEKVFTFGTVFRAEQSFTTRHVTEFTGWDFEIANISSHEEVMDTEEGMLVSMVSYSKGQGFTGAVKRRNFKGAPAGHGHKLHRALGSIGTRKPRRTKPGKKMHGRHGFKTTTLASVPVELIDREHNIIAVRGPVPGAFNTFVYLAF